MNESDIKFNTLFLGSGKELVLTQNIKVKHPSVADILSLGNGMYCEDIYWTYVFSLLSDPYDNMVWLDERGVDYEQVSSFDVFIMKWKELDKEYTSNKEKYDAYGISPFVITKEALSFFLGGQYDFDIGQYQDGSYAIFDKNNPDVQVHKEVFEYMTAFIQVISGLSSENKINPADQNAKRVLIEDMRSELKKKQRNKETNTDNNFIGKRVMALIYGGNGSVTPFNYNDIKIYHIVSGLSIIQKQQHYNQIMSGHYAGTVNIEKVNKEEIDWIR